MYFFSVQYDISTLLIVAKSTLVNIGSGNGLLPTSTKPFPEPMLNNHQWGLVTFNWG